MAVPKRKTTKSRRDKRRAHDFLSPVATSPCPHCHEPRLPHKVCPSCGYYKGKEVLSIEVE